MGQKSRNKKLKKQQNALGANSVNVNSQSSQTNPIEQSFAMLKSEALSVDMQIQDLLKRIGDFRDLLPKDMDNPEQCMPFDLNAMNEDLKKQQTHWYQAYEDYSSFVLSLKDNAQQYFTQALLSRSLLNELKKAREALAQYEFRVNHYRNEIETFIKIFATKESLDRYINIGQTNLDKLQEGDVSNERREALEGMLNKVKHIKSLIYKD